MTRAVRFAAIASLVVLSVSTFAASCPLSGSPLPCYMNFYGAKDMQLASSFYNGGGIPTTPNYGVTFSSNVIVLLPFSAGGSGQFAPTLTDPLNGVAYPIYGALFMNGSSPTQMGVMSVSQGFTTGINFFYTALFSSSQTETVTIWSGANGTGTVLAMLTLAGNDGSCSLPEYCNWSYADINFNGTAKSVTFSGPTDQFGFTDVTLNQSTTAIPEPSTLALLGSGLIGVGYRRFRQILGK
jgi:hypothetical protein